MGSNSSQERSHPKPPSPPPPKSARILIVGAGPSGIHMASRLKKLGYSNIKILEKKDHVGGKSRTVFVDNIPHEMGTTFFGWDYHAVKDLVDQYDAGPVLGPGGRIVGGTDVHAPSIQEGSISPVKWVFGDEGKLLCPAKFYCCCPGILAIQVLDAMERYSKLHTSLLGNYKYGLPPKPSQEAFKSIDMSFAEFLDIHNLNALHPLMVLSVVATGYGYLNELPALYGLWWMPPGKLTGVFKPDPAGVPNNGLMKQGWQTLWQKIYEKDQLDVSFNVNIQRIDRHLDEPDIAIEVFTVDESGNENVFACDFLILACLLEESLNFLKDATEFETEVFSSLKHYCEVTTLYESKESNPDKSIIHFYPDTLNAENQGHVYFEINAQRALDWGNNGKRDKHTAVTNQFFNSYSPARSEEAKDLFMEDMEARKINDVSIVDMETWKYFPHFDQEGINKEYPWKLLESQGSKRTWYIGGSACFETIKDVVAYNDLLISLFFNA